MVLIPVILLLEWHYVVDLFGGILVAVLAIVLNRTAEKGAAKDSLAIERELKELAVQ